MFSLLEIQEVVVVITVASYHEYDSKTLNLSVRYSSTETIQINTPTALNLVFTCLVIASVAHGKSH